MKLLQIEVVCFSSYFVFDASNFLYAFWLLIHFFLSAGNFLSNAVKFTPSGGKLDLDLQCEEVVETKNIEDHIINPSPSASTSEGSLLGSAGIQILSKPSFQMKVGEGKVARLRLSVKDNGIGEFEYQNLVQSTLHHTK